MHTKENRKKFLFLVDELKRCGYLESEIYAIAKIDYTKFDMISEKSLIEEIKVLESQLDFAKKCLAAI